MPNVLAFRTQVGGITVPAGQSKHLGQVDVTPFEKIRIVVDERINSPSALTIRLTMMEGNELVAFLDQIHVAPHSQLTKEYEVPGTKLSLDVDALPGTGNDSLDLLVYGYKA